MDRLQFERQRAQGGEAKGGSGGTAIEKMDLDGVGILTVSENRCLPSRRGRGAEAPTPREADI